MKTVYLQKKNPVFRFISGWILVSFIFSSVIQSPVYAQTVFNLPAPGTMIPLTPAFMPVMMNGLKVHPDNPLLFDFIFDSGKSGLKVESPEFKAESEKLIKYFLAALTIKEDNLWVNLSPFEKDKIAPVDLSQTELGRDMLAQDYILKQLTASLLHPDQEPGKTFWAKVYTKAQEQFGTTEIPVDTFNKVWIIPEKAKILEHNNAAYITGAHLKVMLEEDYLSLQKNAVINSETETKPNDAHSLAAQIVREVVIPEIEKEVNEGKNFAPLRQMYYAMILASWYKMSVKDALLNQVYSNQGKTDGVNVDDPQSTQKIYDQYLEAYKKGVFDFIKEDVDSATQESIMRKYMSGGIDAHMVNNLDVQQATNDKLAFAGPQTGAMVSTQVARPGDGAMAVTGNEQASLQLKRANNEMIISIGQLNVIIRRQLDSFDKRTFLDDWLIQITGSNNPPWSFMGKSVDEMLEEPDAIFDKLNLTNQERKKLTGNKLRFLEILQSMQEAIALAMKANSTLQAKVPPTGGPVTPDQNMLSLKPETLAVESNRVVLYNRATNSNWTFPSQLVVNTINSTIGALSTANIKPDELAIEFEVMVPKTPDEQYGNLGPILASIATGDGFSVQAMDSYRKNQTTQESERFAEWKLVLTSSELTGLERQTEEQEKRLNAKRTSLIEWLQKQKKAITILSNLDSKKSEFKDQLRTITDFPMNDVARLIYGESGNLITMAHDLTTWRAVLGILSNKSDQPDVPDVESSAIRKLMDQIQSILEPQDPWEAFANMLPDDVSDRSGDQNMTSVITAAENGKVKVAAAGTSYEYEPKTVIQAISDIREDIDSPRSSGFVNILLNMGYTDTDARFPLIQAALEAKLKGVQQATPSETSLYLSQEAAQSLNLWLERQKQEINSILDDQRMAANQRQVIDLEKVNFIESTTQKIYADGSAVIFYLTGFSGEDLGKIEVYQPLRTGSTGTVLQFYHKNKGVPEKRVNLPGPHPDLSKNLEAAIAAINEGSPDQQMVFTLTVAEDAVTIRSLGVKKNFSAQKREVAEALRLIQEKLKSPYSVLASETGLETVSQSMVFLAPAQTDEKTKEIIQALLGTPTLVFAEHAGHWGVYDTEGRILPELGSVLQKKVQGYVQKYGEALGLVPGDSQMLTKTDTQLPLETAKNQMQILIPKAIRIIQEINALGVFTLQAWQSMMESGNINWDNIRRDLSRMTDDRADYFNLVDKDSKIRDELLGQRGRLSTILKEMTDAVNLALGSTPDQNVATKKVVEPPGGIDFNRKNLDMNVAREGEGIQMKFDPAMIQDFTQGNFTGVVPVILNIVPISSPMPILGFVDELSPAEEVEIAGG